MNDSAPLADGTYTYTAPGMYTDYTITVQMQGGRPTLGSLNGEPMTGTFWQGVILLDLGRFAYTFTPAPEPIGKARACRLHKILSRLGLGHADHYRAASAALGREVGSLAALSESEGRKVWNHARRLWLAHTLTAA